MQCITIFDFFPYWQTLKYNDFKKLDITEVGVIAKLLNFTHWNLVNFVELQYTSLENTKTSGGDRFERH